MRHILRLFAALVLGVLVPGLLLLTPSQAAYGQATNTSGAIQGTIEDANGAILPGASVTVTNLDTNAQKELVSDSAGFYSLTSLVPGRYQISVTAPGFATTTTTVTVQIGTASHGDLKLKVGQATEQVTVSSEALQVNTSESTVEGVLTAQQIDNLPISGRNFLDLSQLEPGVQLQSGETFDPTKAGYSSISFNGVNGRTARILLDGQDISDETVGTTTLNVSQGSIEEFQMSRSSLDISNELTSSGAVTVSTRSGSNKFHGQGFGLFRDQRAGAAAGPDATNYPFQRDQMGGRFGGPILKDKLFFFGSAERVKQDAFNSVSELAPFTNLNGGYTSPFRDNYYVNREDYNGPLGVHFFFRIAYEDNLDDATYGYGYSRYGNKDNTPAMAGGADFLSGKFTHSVRVSYLKFHNAITDQTGGGILNPAAGVFLVNHGFYSGPNLLAPQATFQSGKQFRYDGTVTAKAHVLNFGVSMNRILGAGFASFYGLAPEVSANFALGAIGTGGSGDASDPTAYPTRLIAMGNGQGYSTEKAGFGLPAGGQSDWRLGIYFGDTWKIRPRITVNYGIRYSRDTGRSDSDMAPIPCSEAVNLVGDASPCTSGNLLDALEPGLGARIRQPNEDMGPKAGFAYDVKGNGKTVIRGGVGLYFENNIFNNTLWDRPARLAQGLFFGDKVVRAGASSFTMPDGSNFSTFSDGTKLADLWGEAISVSRPYWVELQQMYQANTKQVGAVGNGGYVAGTLSEGIDPTGLMLYAPNFRSARSIQFNIGVEREMWKGGIVAADYIRNVGEHIQQAIDVNHVGDAKYLNMNAANNAIAATLAEYGVNTVDEAIAAGATIADFAGNGLDSGNAGQGGYPASLNGLTPDTGAAFPGVNPAFGQMQFAYPLGRSVYNALQTNLRQSARVPLPGLRVSNFEISYTLSRFITTGGSDQNFTPVSYDNNNPLAFAGPGGMDRTHQLSYGGSFGWAGGITTSIIGHFYSALPTTLYLDSGGNTTGEIFKSDITGDGSIEDILPGYKAGAFMRSVKPGDLSTVIANYNATAAGRLTPAGQTLVSNGLLTATQLVELGAVTRSIAAPPVGNVGNGSLRTFDLTVARPFKWARLGEDFSIEPSFSAFNLFNLANYGGLTGNLLDQQQSGAANGTDSSYSDADPFGRNSLRVGNGSGVFSQGAARVLEYGVRINF